MKKIFHTQIPNINICCYCCKKSITHNKCICNSIIIIQKYWRGYFIRKNNRKLKDSMTFDLLNNLIDSYNNYKSNQEKINIYLKHKKIRMVNFPSEISENIVKFAICKKYRLMPCWDTDKGDLTLFNIRLEVKGSIDLLKGGPSSFGPTETWDRIYFIDAKDTYKKRYKIYEILLSNKSPIWFNIKVNKNQTYKEQCKEKRRPRIKFNELINQLPNRYINVLFDGYLCELL